MRTAKQNQKSRVLDHHRPRRLQIGNVATADDIGRDMRGGAETVIAQFIDVAAMQTEKTFQHARRMM